MKIENLPVVIGAPDRQAGCGKEGRPRGKLRLRFGPCIGTTSFETRALLAICRDRSKSVSLEGNGRWAYASEKKGRVTGPPLSNQLNRCGYWMTSFKPGESVWTILAPASKVRIKSVALSARLATMTRTP